MMQVAGQSFGGSEDAFDDVVVQCVGVFELVAVLFEAWAHSRKAVLDGILPVCGHDSVECESRRLLSDFDVRIALYEFLAEC